MGFITDLKTRAVSAIAELLVLYLLWLLQQAWYFDRDDVALKGFHKFFKKASEEEREHAEKMMKYQNMRGGRVVLQPVDVS